MKPFSRHTTQGLGLKTQGKPSHNNKAADPRIIALVQFLARNAAEEDYNAFLRQQTQDNEGED